MSPLEYFRLLAAEFSSVDDQAVAKWLAMASALANVSGLDDERAAMAKALLAAHLLAMSSRGGAQAVISEREGDLSRTYSHSTSGYASTGYGQQYADLTAVAVGASIMTRVG